VKLVDWQIMLLAIFVLLLAFMLSGLPVAFCFLSINLLGVFFLWGGEHGLRQLTMSFADSITSFTLVPIPLFILMGELMFHSGVAPLMLSTVDKLVGRIPGRLSLLAVGGGIVFATLSGSSVAGVAMLGGTLVPEMQKRGYSKAMSLGPILGAGGLAVLIPPSSFAVLLGAVANISIGDILIAIISPGLLLATAYATYIIVVCKLRPSLAPAYDVNPSTAAAKFVAFVRYILPLGFIVFLVTGVIFLGIATPSEAAACGAIGCVALTAAYRALSWNTIKKSLASTTRVTVMLFMIIMGASALSQILAYTEVSQGLVKFAAGLPIPPIFVIVAMQLVVLLMGCFMEVVSIMMITIPIFMPVLTALHFNPVWFATILLVNLEMAMITPPFGMSLFVMKATAPSDVTIGDCILAALPFIACHVFVMVLLMCFPEIVLWLPGFMG
jgi:tripartite ATP-independent transporter DctM subunit